MFPNLETTRVSCGGMVSPDPHNWQAIPGYTTGTGHRAFMFKPDGSVWYWNPAPGRMCLCPEVEADAARDRLAAMNARMSGAVS